MDFESVGVEPSTVEADRWTEQARRLFLRFGPTQHLTANHQIEHTEAGARLVAAMQAEHFAQDPQIDARYTLGGFYHVDVQRQHTSWKITGMKLEVTWRQGDRRAVLATSDRAEGR